MGHKVSQTQVISVVLITSVALVLAGTAYYWGMPLLEKTQKSIELEDAEVFLNELIDAMISVSQTGDVKTLEVELKGTLTIDTEKDEITYEIKAPTVYYPVTTYVPLNDAPPFKREVVIFSSGEEKVVPLLNSTPVTECKMIADCENGLVKESTEAQCAFEGDTENLDSFGEGEIIVSSDGSMSYLTVTRYCDEYGIAYLESMTEEKIPGVKGVNSPLVLLVRALFDMNKENFHNIYRIVSREVVDGATREGMYIDIVSSLPKIVRKDGRVTIVISRESTEVRPSESSLGGDLSIVKVRVEVR